MSRPPRPALALVLGLASALFVLTGPPVAHAGIPEEGPELLNARLLVFGTESEGREALRWIEKRGKPDLAAHVITAMRYSRLPQREMVATLRTLTGHDATRWFDWMLWQQRNDRVVPHRSIVAFKASVFRAIDPAFQRFFRPGLDYDIRPEEIVWGGVRVDGIPALDLPAHVPAASAGYLRDDDEVFGVEVNGDVRAYPLRILGWHEMFNDVVGGVPVSLAYCTLCNAGILFEGDHEDREALGVEEPFTFGSSGFLYRSNKLMYDRQTDSLWNQFTGKPVAGTLRGSGVSLTIRPVVITTWKAWKAQHPDTRVLSLETGHVRDYGSGVVYRDYFASSELMFPALGDESRKLDHKDQVFGLRLTGGSKAWPLDELARTPVLNDRVGLVDVVLIGTAGTRTVRAYERKGLVFGPDLTTADGRTWQLTEEALVDGQGQRLKRLPGHVSYWFAWAGYLGAG